MDLQEMHSQDHYLDVGINPKLQLSSLFLIAFAWEAAEELETTCERWL